MSTKQDILTILEAHKGESISGEQIASEIHVTRSAVWKGIKALKEEGYPITAGTNRGYLLAEDSDIFSAASVQTLLTGAAASLQVEVRKQVTSTNTILKEDARAGAPAGRVLIAQEQTAGKGRMGRSFYSPQDSGLYISLLLRPKLTMEQATLLTTVAAVAVAGSIEEITGEPVDIKWVNDVYRHGRKLCGILTEASVDFESGGLEYAVVGIGVNLTDPAGGFPEAIRDIAGSLYGENNCPTGVRSRLAAAILNNFIHYYEKLPETVFLEEYRRRSFLLGKDIYILGALAPDGSHTGEPRLAHADCIDDQLRLVVTYPDGHREALSSGEVSVRPVH